jgi:hypothetical protein
VQKRVNGKERRVTLAPERLLALNQARLRAQRMLLDMRDGIDPVEERRRRVVESLSRRSRRPSCRRPGAVTLGLEPHTR